MSNVEIAKKILDEEWIKYGLLNDTDLTINQINQALFDVQFDLVNTPKRVIDQIAYYYHEQNMKQRQQKENSNG